MMLTITDWSCALLFGLKASVLISAGPTISRKTTFVEGQPAAAGALRFWGLSGVFGVAARTRRDSDPLGNRPEGASSRPFGLFFPQRYGQRHVTSGVSNHREEPRPDRDPPDRNRRLAQRAPGTRPGDQVCEEGGVAQACRLTWEQIVVGKKPCRRSMRSPATPRSRLVPVNRLRCHARTGGSRISFVTHVM